MNGTTGNMINEHIGYSNSLWSTQNVIAKNMTIDPQKYTQKFSQQNFEIYKSCYLTDQKRVRNKFSREQILLLEKVFEQTHYPDSTMRLVRVFFFFFFCKSLIGSQHYLDILKENSWAVNYTWAVLKFKYGSKTEEQNSENYTPKAKRTRCTLNSNWNECLPNA